MSLSAVRDGYPASFEYATALALAASAPDAVLDPVVQRVLEAGVNDTAGSADLARAVDANTIAGKEGNGRIVATIALSHPDRCGFFGSMVVHQRAFRLCHLDGGPPARAPRGEGNRTVRSPLFRRPTWLLWFPLATSQTDWPRDSKHLGYNQGFVRQE